MGSIRLDILISPVVQSKNFKSNNICTGSNYTLIILLFPYSTKVKSVQAKLDGARSQLDKVKKEITRLEVEIKTSERNLKKAQDKCEAYESEVTEAENKMREMKAQREALVEDGEKIKNKLQELEQRQEEISENLKVVKEKLKKYEEEETKHKSEKIEFDEATEKFTTGKRALVCLKQLKFRFDMKIFISNLSLLRLYIQFMIGTSCSLPCLSKKLYPVFPPIN